MLDKNQIAEQFGISIKTVERTLQVTPLGKDREEFSPEEIQEFFAVAREMLSDGKKYDEVAQHFGITADTAATADAAYQEVVNQHEDEDLNRTSANRSIDGLSQATAEVVAGMVRESVKEVAPYIPALVAATLNEEMQQGGAVREAFDRMEDTIKVENRTPQANNTGAGAAFLISKITQGRQLKAAKATQQLPEASS